MHHFRDEDIVLGEEYGEIRMERYLAVFHHQVAFDDAFLGYAMNGQVALGTYGIGSVFGEVDVFNDTAAEGRVGKLNALHVIFVEVFFLERAVEPVERTDPDAEGEYLLAHIHPALHFIAGSTDQFERGVGTETDAAVVGTIHLCTYARERKQ